MPRIDPQQLLACLTPLLAVNGGIKSSGEVIRLANLMEKYSKKLVSKCIYIQILKCTETDLLGQFMAAGGWNLVHTWLNDGVNSSNWAFVQEILEMLLLCPVDGNRLKSNHTPKIVKNLSLNLSQNAMITALSKKLVEQWLKIAHQEKQILQQQNGSNGTVIFNNINSDDKSLLDNDSAMIKSESDIKISPSTENNINNNNTSNNNHNNSISNGTVDEDSPKKSSENVKYKISNKESGLILSIKRSTSPINEQDTKILKSPDSKPKSEHKSKSSSSSSSSDKDKTKKSSSSSSSHKSSSSSKTSHRDKDRSSSSHRSSSSSSSKDRHKDSSKSSSSSKHSSSSSSSSRDKDKDREKRKKEQAEKEQAEKDKETLSFLAPLPSSKLQRIPKRPHSESEKSDSDPSSKSAKSNEVIEKKKPSISIEVRKGDKPKTVKTHNSTFRDHGLAEQPPPPPSRKGLKKPAPVAPVILPVTTPSIQSPKPISPPPAKRIHLEKALDFEVPERVGGVKLIKPKPMLMESTGFLDALETSAMLHKKDSKKRKRLSSGSKKEEPESPKIETKPLKFYKDTLEDEEKDEKITNGISSSSPTKDIENTTNGDASTDEKSTKGDESKSDENSEKEKSDEVVEENEDEPEQKRPPGIGCGPDGPPGIISIPKRKRPKRSLRWRTDNDLTEVRYFELDENERVNVTKTFSEQKQDEHTRERMMMRSKVVEYSEWHALKLIDNVPEIPYGSKSLEAAVQAERERNTLQEMFFNNRSMYDSPHEPDPEEYETLEPQIIPLEDVTGNPDSVNNFKDVQWPAPKGDQPQYISQGGFGGLFNNINLASSINIPPAATNATINPLAGLNFTGLLPAIPQDTATINLMGIGIVQPTLPPPFMQPPPMIQNNYQSNIPYQNRGSSSGNSSNFNNRENFNNNSNNNRNRMGSNSNSGGGSNWVRGNATLRRGMCHQYQRTGFCRNQKTGCPYVHER
ncbi:hypothetical protein ACKWTF_001104 [Chironomus riparius]